MKRILFLIAPLLILFLAFRPVNSITVTGKITDDKGSPISSATVIEKGTRTGALSAKDGTYKITVANSNGTLVFSAVGHVVKEIKINGQTVINVTLNASDKSMSEVVVSTQLGVNKRVKTLGYSQTIKGDALVNSPSQIYGYSNGLAGKIAGVQFSSPKGLPDEDGDGV
ncbi:MAG: carboxypeptidase-like regulatory domain-containing protein, partial [Chitinophagales bacterium]